MTHTQVSIGKQWQKEDQKRTKVNWWYKNSVQKHDISDIAESSECRDSGRASGQEL